VEVTKYVILKSQNRFALFLHDRVWEIIRDIIKASATENL